MKKMLFVMPALLTGCTGFSPLRSPAPELQVPALVFVDGQIRSSAETVAHTQQQVQATVPAPSRAAPIPRHPRLLPLACRQCRLPPRKTH